MVSTFKFTDYSIDPNFSPVFNILTATTGESSNYTPEFLIYGKIIRTPLLNDISSEEELHIFASKFANKYIPVWTMYNKDNTRFPVIFYRIPSKIYVLNTNINKTYDLETGFLQEYINEITNSQEVKLITNYKSL